MAKKKLGIVLNVGLGSLTCSEIGDCDRIRNIYQMGYTRLDGDGDGKPCESLCRYDRENE